MSILSDYKVIELAEVFQGPVAGQVLADYGAEVIKVEKPQVGDIFRNTDVYGLKNNCLSSHFAAANRNKKSICIDITTDKGKEVLMALVKESDVLLHNYRPGVLDRLGFGYEALSKICPKLIYAAATGYGETGPLATFGGQELVVQALSGYCATNSGDKAPVIVNAPAIDFGSGMVLAQGILLALMEREKSGKGQKVTTSLLGTAAAITAIEVSSLINSGIPINWFETGLNFVFRTTDGWVLALSFFRENPLGLMCEALGVEDLSKKLGIENANVLELSQHKSTVEPTLAQACERLTTEEALSRFRAKDLLCAPILSVEDAMAQPQMQEINAMVDAHVTGQRDLRVVDSPLKFSRTPKREHINVPLLGEHTEEILARLGFDHY
ncbi:MAG: CaiB/BaiF CoA-transferase family protein [Candidatus Competibacteraceae bacterium]|jgi:crotonobetainyl-CoA:carnitine CoA-transferase CaiB-like acyl-CoA transferase|nr:CaiB/BaiF CoA-transferase family protein [Candidatus Competibacteraceae bacterium]